MDKMNTVQDEFLLEDEFINAPRQPNELVVRYHNDVYKRTSPVQLMSEVELNIFFSICARMKDQQTKRVEFTFAELKKMTNCQNRSNTDFQKPLVEVHNKLIQTYSTIKEGNKIIGFALFHEYEIDLDEKTVSIQVSERFAYMLNKLDGNFTRFELDEFVKIKGLYAKRLYCQLKQFRTTGKYRVSMAEFRDIMKIPQSYKMFDIARRVIEQSFNELTEMGAFTNLRYRKVKQYGGKVVALEFTFTPEKKQLPKKKSSGTATAPKAKNKPKSTSANNIMQSPPEYFELPVDNSNDTNVREDLVSEDPFAVEPESDPAPKQTPLRKTASVKLGTDTSEAYITKIQENGFLEKHNDYFQKIGGNDVIKKSYNQFVTRAKFTEADFDTVMRHMAETAAVWSPANFQNALFKVR